MMSSQTMAEENVTEAIPFFRVSNIEVSVRYYAEGLGFRMTNTWIVDGRLRWCSLKLGGASLMLQEFPKEGHDSWVPQAKVGEGMTICFVCKDAIAIYRQAIRKGLKASRPFVGNAMWVTELKDPDGYRISFESPTDEPEDSELRE
jgi:lactoylglutathione lyase